MNALSGGGCIAVSAAAAVWLMVLPAMQAQIIGEASILAKNGTSKGGYYYGISNFR